MPDTPSLKIVPGDALQSALREQQAPYLQQAQVEAPRLYAQLASRAAEISTPGDEVFVDERTSCLSLPLPHSLNWLERDVLRLRDSFGALDEYARATGTALDAKADAQAVTTALSAKADKTAVETALAAKADTLSVPRLSDAVNSPARDVAASSLAVKTAYDKALEALSPHTLLSSAGSRAQPVAAGTDFTVPAYVVGSGRLAVYLSGLRCLPGADSTKYQYAEVGAAGTVSTAIRWHDAIPETCDIFVEVR